MPDEPRWPNEVTATDVVRLPKRIVWGGALLLAAIFVGVLWIASEVRALRGETRAVVHERAMNHADSQRNDQGGDGLIDGR